MTIRAVLIFEEREPPTVNISMEVPPTEGETYNESAMMLTYLAFNNVITDPKYFKRLGEILLPEVKKIIKEMEEKDASKD